MKTPRYFYGVLTGCLVLAGLALWPHTGRATASTNAAPAVKGKNAATATNTADASLPVPLSVFDVTAVPTKNPFFPNSLRPPVRPNTAVAPSISATSFQLNALSGSDRERLAMINHRTLGVGESVELTMPTGQKVTIRLLQIKDNDDSVVIRVVSPPQADLIELSLAGNKGQHIYFGPNEAGHQGK
jgi:hypothetical protein